jgi:hypothetical protein
LSYLTAINSLDTENLSGLQSLLVIRSQDVTTFPDIFEGIAQSEPVFVPGRDWLKWVATYSTSGFSTRPEDSMEGISANQALDFIIPRHTSGITSMLRKAENDTFILLFTDFNGQRYLFGSPEKPVRFSFDMQTGSGSDRNQYACRFYSDSSGNLAIYPPSFGTGDTDFSACPSVIIRRGSSEGPILAIAPAGSTLVISSPYSFGYQIIAS